MPPSPVFRTRDYEIHPERRRVLRQGRDLDIGARAFDLLLTLVESRDRVLGKRELLAKAWPGVVVEENALHVQISLLRKKLGRGAIATVTGQGYRFVDEIRGVPAEVVAAPSTSERSGNLPSPTTRLIGRRAELAECLRLLGEGAQLSIIGVGGCGKTRLAIAAAHAYAGPEATAWFVDLSRAEEGADVLASIVAAIGARERAGEPLLGTLTAHLRHRPVVLVLDNCEHVVDDVARVVRAVAEPGRHRVIVTSRQPLHVPGEQLFALPALSLPASAAPADVLGSEAVQLFLDRARLLNPRFTVRPEDLRHVADICVRLDGIPLAIELAAARTKLLPVAHLSARLDARLKLLVGGTADQARQQTLRASVQWSYELLDAAEQRLFRELAVFAGGCTLESAAAVLHNGDDHLALEGLTSLYDKSLVVSDDAGDRAPRHRMLHMVRDFACEVFELAEDRGARTRHLHHFAQLAEQLVRPGQLGLDAATLSTLRAEQDNFQEAMSSADRASDAEAALRLAGSLWPYWLATAQLVAGATFSRRAIDIARSANAWTAPLLARVALGLGNLQFYHGLYAEARDCADDALTRARLVDDPATVGFSLKLLAGACHALGDDASALAHYRATLVAANENGDAVLQAAAYNNLAEVHRGLGQLAEADAGYRQSIDALTVSGGQCSNLALVKSNQARLRIAMDRPRDAAEGLLEALRVAMSTSNQRIADQVVDIATAVASQVGDHVAAARFHGAAATRMQASGWHREPLDAAFVATWTESSRASLGDAAFDREVRLGRTLDFAEALNEVETLLLRSVRRGAV